MVRMMTMMTMVTMVFDDGGWGPPGDHHDREAGVGVKGNRESDEALGVAVTGKNWKQV